MNELLELTHGRHNHLIDPGLSIWSWEIPAYLFLGGLAAGLLVLPALLELWRKEKARSAALRHAPLLGLGLISLGMVALLLDLENKAHVYRFYLAFKPTSPMSWGAWILVLVYPVGLLQWLGGLTADERGWLSRAKLLRVAGLGRGLASLAAWADGRRTGLLVSGITLGVGLGLYTGLLLGTMAARPQWNTAILGPLFLTSGLSTGAALLLLLRLEPDERHTLVRWDLAAIALELVLLAVMLLGFQSGDRAAQSAGSALLGGPFTSAFWSLVVVAGLLVPLAMEVVELRQHRRLSAMTPVLILLGGLSLRWVLLLAGQASSFRGI